MKRRALIQAAGVVAAGGLAGCIGGQPGSPGDERGGTPTETGTLSATPTPSETESPTSTPGPAPTEPSASFTVTAQGCGNQENRADVTFDDGTVTVEGTIWGNDACHTGRLESMTLEGGTLTVRVAAERPDDGTEPMGCAQCITEIDYRLTVETPSRPDEVVVVHRGETVATARH